MSLWAHSTHTEYWGSGQHTQGAPSSFESHGAQKGLEARGVLPLPPWSTTSPFPEPGWRVMGASSRIQ